MCLRKALHQSKKAPPIIPRMGSNTGAKIPPMRLSVSNRRCDFDAAPEPAGPPVCVTVVVLVWDKKNGLVSDEGPVTVTTLGRGAETTVCVIVTVDATGVVIESEVTVAEIEVVVVEVGIEAVVVSELVAVVEELELVSVTDALETTAHVPAINIWPVARSTGSQDMDMHCATEERNVWDVQMQSVVSIGPVHPTAAEELCTQSATQLGTP